MKEILKLGGILLLVTAVAGAALSMVNVITKPKIEEQKRLATQRALKVALPKANPDVIEPVTENEEVSYYVGYKSEDKEEIAGIAYVAKGPGYSSVIETMVGVDTTGKIIGIKIIDQKETPGLGTKIEEVRYGEAGSWFQQQFENRSPEQVAVDKDGGEILSVTGATISSRAVANSIKQGFAELKKNTDRFE